MKPLLSIALQILLAVIVTVVVVLGISSVVELNILKHREIQQLHERGTVTADRISNSLAYPLWNLNQSETERVVLDELAAREVAAVQVFDEHGQQYVGKFKAEDGSIHDVTPGTNTATDESFARDISFRSNRIGSVKLDVSARYLQPEVAKLRWGIAIKLLVLVMVLSVVLSIALRMLVVRRLGLLKSWVEHHDAGTDPPRFKYSAEINSLAQAFGTMSINLRQQHEELEREHARLLELNTELERQIAERAEAEAALRESENRFEQITENIGEVLWLQSPNYEKLLYISAAYEKIWGRPKQSLYDDPYSFLDAVHPEDRHWVEEQIKTKRAVGFSLEYRIVKPDGSVRWIWDRGFPIKDNAGVVHRVAGIAEDITGRKKAQEELRRYVDEVRDLYNNAPCGYHSLDENGFYVLVNDTELNWLGYNREEVIGKKRFSDMLIPEHRTTFEELYPQFVATGVIRDVEYQLLSKDGSTRTVLLSAGSTKNASGKFVMSSATVYDITERRYMEQALRANEEVLRLFVKHTPAAIAMFDNDMRYLLVSDRFLTDYHLEGQDIIGKSHYDVFPNLPERWKEAHKRILAGAVERKDEDPFEEADGSQGWLQWESLPWRKANGEIGGLILFTQVITQRKRDEQALRASEERFAKAFELSPYRMGIFRATDNMILDVNECWLRETGFTREETINHSLFDLDQWLSEEARNKIAKMLQEERSVYTFEGMMKTKSGEERCASASAARVEFAESHVTCGSPKISQNNNVPRKSVAVSFTISGSELKN